MHVNGIEGRHLRRRRRATIAHRLAHDLYRREYTDHARVTRADPTPAR
ncbi:hypothetical protein ABT154_04790 [Streptomyces sp. NPDC001728]